MAARDDQGDEREDRLVLLLARIEQPRGVEVALEVVDADERPVVDERQRLREVDPDQQRSGEARAVRDRDRVDVLDGRTRRRPAPRRGPARSSAGGPGRRPPGRSRRSRRGARSGWRRRSSGSAGRSRRARSRSRRRRTRPRGSAARSRCGCPAGRRSGAAAGPARPSASRSSGRVGAGRGVERRPEAVEPLRVGSLGDRLGGHDQRVLAVVAVVARPEPDRPEAVLLVQPAGRRRSRGGPRASPPGRAGRSRGRGTRAAAAPRSAGGARTGAPRTS